MKLTCPKCKETKLEKDFYRYKRSSTGRQSYCKLCSHSASRKHYKENHSEQRERSRKWKSENPDKNSALEMKRLAAKLRRTPPWLTEEHYKEIDNFYKLRLEKQKSTGEVYHVDHIVPLQGKNVSGLHVPWNLQVIPAVDNYRKKNHFDDWK